MIDVNALRFLQEQRSSSVSASESINCTNAVFVKRNYENEQLPRSYQSKRMKKESPKMPTYVTDRHESFQFLVQEQLLRGEDDERCENCREVCHVQKKTVAKYAMSRRKREFSQKYHNDKF